MDGEWRITSILEKYINMVAFEIFYIFLWLCYSNSELYVKQKEYCMSIQKLCLFLSLFSLWTHHSYCAMNEIEPIKIDNGLLTEVPKILLATKGYFFDGARRVNKGVLRADTTSTLAELMAINRTEIEFDPLQRGIPYLLFFPTVVKAIDNNLINLGSYCKAKHKEAKEACRQNKAIFYPFQQGLIIYSNQLSDFKFFREKKKELEDMAHHNLEQKFLAYTSLLHVISVEPDFSVKPKKDNTTVEENNVNATTNSLAQSVLNFFGINPN